MAHIGGGSASHTRSVFAALAGARARLAARDERITHAQVRVSKIPAPTGAEQVRGRWISRRFFRLGYDVEIDSAGNVIARREGGTDEPPVCVCAHLDTVFPPETDLSIRKDGSRLIGPGIGDNGRGLAAMLAIAGTLARPTLQLRRPVLFAATTGEEGSGDLRGAKNFFAESGANAAAAIVIDGAGDERIVHRALGARRFRVTFTGPGGHSWAAFGTPNPVHAAAIAGASLASLTLPREPRTTLSVGRIGGGMSVNSIPEDAWLEVDVRSSSSSVLDRVESELRAACAAAAREENARRSAGTAPLALAISQIGDRPCGDTPAEESLVRVAVEASALIGRDAELVMASTDANVPISLGIPAIAIGGGGRGGNAHTREEWYDNTAGTLGISRALTIICATAGLIAAD